MFVDQQRFCAMTVDGRAQAVVWQFSLIMNMAHSLPDSSCSRRHRSRTQRSTQTRGTVPMAEDPCSEIDMQVDTDGSKTSGSDTSGDECMLACPDDGKFSLSSLTCAAHSEPCSAQSEPVPGGCQHLSNPLPCSPVQEKLTADHQEMIWFNPNYLPRDVQEILTWHPNRVRALLVTELRTRLQHEKPRRSKKKSFDPLRALDDAVDPNGTRNHHKFSWDDRVRGRDLYARVCNIVSSTGQTNLTAMTRARWEALSHEDKDEWVVLHRVMNHPRLSKILDMAPHLTPARSNTRAHSKGGAKETKADGQSFQGCGFCLSYNTDLGQEDPDVIKLLQSGKTGEDLFKCMRGMTIYQEAFTDLWELANNVARSKRFGTVNVGMEHSSHGDHEARVHFHVFIGPDVRSGVGFGWNPILTELDSSEVRWNGISPHVKASRPQKKSWNQIYQAIVAGSYYVAGPKIGSIMKRSTFKPIEDRASLYNISLLPFCWIHRLHVLIVHVCFYVWIIST